MYCFRAGSAVATYAERCRRANRYIATAPEQRESDQSNTRLARAALFNRVGVELRLHLTAEPVQ